MICVVCLLFVKNFRLEGTDVRTFTYSFSIFFHPGVKWRLFMIFCSSSCEVAGVFAEPSVCYSLGVAFHVFCRSSHCHAFVSIGAGSATAVGAALLSAHPGTCLACSWGNVILLAKPHIFGRFRTFWSVLADFLADFRLQTDGLVRVRCRRCGNRLREVIATLKHSLSVDGKACYLLALFLSLSLSLSLRICACVVIEGHY